MEIEDWILSLGDQEGIDLEAQRRELERLEQARQDRLVAEKLQDDLARLPLEREEERDCPQPDTTENMDDDVALLLTHVEEPQPSSFIHMSSSAEAQSGPSISHSSSSHNVSMVIGSPPSPAAPRECWGEINPTSTPVINPQSHSSSDLPSPFHVTLSPQSTPSPSVFSHHQSLASGLSYTLSDAKLAEQLQEQERLEREQHKKHNNSQTIRDAEIAKALQEEEELQQAGRESSEVVEQNSLTIRDAEIARALYEEEQQLQQAGDEDRDNSQTIRDAEIAMALQEEEEQLHQTGRGSGGDGDNEQDIDIARRLQDEINGLSRQRECDEQIAHALETESSPVQEDTSHDEELARQIAAQFEETTPFTTPTSTTHNDFTQQLTRPPKWWTMCPNCPPTSNLRYHLIEIKSDENEWLSVTQPLQEAGFTTKRLLRVQNMKLYQRLQFEKQQMKEGVADDGDYEVNERLFYHTSAASVTVICGEGLDQRLARKGRFGSGVYFRYINY